jgi:hypothetical protein
MAEVVELFGAPGAGKSSLVGVLDGRRVAGRRIIAAERLVRVARVGSPSAVSPGAPGSAGLPRRVLERLVRRARTTEERQQMLAARLSDWSPLVDLLRDAPLGREGMDPIGLLRAPGWMLATLEARALADAASDDLLVVIGEGFVQRARLLCGDDPDAAQLDRFVTAVPAARLQVHLTAEADGLVERLQRRSSTNERHRGLDAAGLAASVQRDAALLSALAARLRGRGDAVLDISTSSGDPLRSADLVLERLASVLA